MADRFESEIALFRRKKLQEGWTGRPDYDDLCQRMERRVDGCAEHLQSLSAAGVPAWLLLEQAWNWVVTKSFRLKEYKFAETWIELRKAVDALESRLRDTPNVGGLMKPPDTHKLINDLTEWSALLGASPFVDTSRSIYGHPVPHERSVIFPGDPIPPNTRRPALDEAHWLTAWTIRHCVDTLTCTDGDIPLRRRSHWKATAGMIYGFLGPLDGASQAESSTMPIGNTSEPAQLIQVRLRGYEECWPSREHLESVANLQLDIAVRSFVSDAFDFSKYDSRQRDTWPEVLKDYLAVNER